MVMILEKTGMQLIANDSRPGAFILKKKGSMHFINQNGSQKALVMSKTQVDPAVAKTY